MSATMREETVDRQFHRDDRTWTVCCAIPDSTRNWVKMAAPPKIRKIIAEVLAVSLKAVTMCGERFRFFSTRMIRATTKQVIGRASVGEKTPPKMPPKVIG